MKKILSEEEYKEVMGTIRLLDRAKTKDEEQELMNSLAPHLRTVLNEVKKDQ